MTTDINSAIRTAHMTITTCTEAIAQHGANVAPEVVAAWEAAIAQARTDLAELEADLAASRARAPKIFRGYVS